jgi:hypothetical protein
VLVKQTEASEAYKHAHQLARTNLQVCSTCGRFIVTTYRETTNGQLVIEELELDVKIRSSRIGRLRTATPENLSRPELFPPSEVVMRAEDTCW